MKTLILLRGLPGAGKTSIAEELVDDNTVIHSADDFFYENGPNVGKYDFDASKLYAAHTQCQTRVETAMVNKTDRIIVANTFTTDKEMKPYIEMANNRGYRLVSLIVENRHGNASVHNVPEDAMQRMKDRFTIKLR